MRPRLPMISPSFFQSRKPVKISRIAFLTDLEGQGLENFFKLNEQNIVKFHPDNGLSFCATEHEPHFIFGGDVTDRGSHDLDFLRWLFDFKMRHPKNVHLLAGNREIKQCRLKYELDDQFIRQRLIKNPRPHWLPNTTYPRDYLEAHIKKLNQQVNPADEKELIDYVNSLSLIKCKEIYLKWMLEQTMGCPHTFRYRGEELSRNRDHAFISDEEIVESFIKEAMPDGLVGQYLQLAQVGVIIPDTGVMAVHGGLRDSNIGRLPGMTIDQPIIKNAKEWVAKSNEWFQNQIQDWMNSKVTQLTPPGFTPLDRSVLLMPHQIKSFITADMQNSKQQFIAPDQTVNDYLKENDLHLVLRGHHPEGDYPVILRSPNALFINGDTGYAAFDPKNPDDTRGVASHAMQITATRNLAHVNIAGVLRDGTNVHTDLTVTENGVSGDPYVGLVTSDHQLVQCHTKQGYRLIYQEGVKVSYATLNEKEIDEVFAQPLECQVGMRAGF